MGRMVDVDLLVGAEEIARRLEVGRPQVVYEWRRRLADFPLPVFSLSRTSIWYWPDIERWAARTGRLPVPGPQPRRARRRR
ncbi:MAG TPA: hypothetical protein VFZ97_06735 [Acidimicrobiales bacterium]